MGSMAKTVKDQKKKAQKHSLELDKSRAELKLLKAQLREKDLVIEKKDDMLLNQQGTINNLQQKVAYYERVFTYQHQSNPQFSQYSKQIGKSSNAKIIYEKDQNVEVKIEADSSSD